MPAGELEAVVFGQLKAMFKAPEMIVRVWEQAREYDPNVKEFHAVKTVAAGNATYYMITKMNSKSILSLHLK